MKLRLTMSLFSPLPACRTDSAEDLENQQPFDPNNKDSALNSKRPNKATRSLPPPLLPLSVINGENNIDGQQQAGGILKPFDNDIFKSPLPAKSLKVTFMTPARTPKAVKSFSPSAWTALRELDNQERWTERTSVVTKQDHDDCVILARELLEEIVDNISSACTNTVGEPAPSLTPLQLEEILTPVTPIPIEKRPDDNLFDFTDAKATENPQQDSCQTLPVYDPFSPPREEVRKPEQPAGGTSAVDKEAKQEVEAVPSIADTTAVVGQESNQETLLEIEGEVSKKEEPTEENPISQAKPVTGVADQTDPVTMGEVGKNIYDLKDEDLGANPFGGSNKMQNSPPLPRAKSSGYNINFDDITDPFGSGGGGTQMSNSPPKTSTVANSPPKTTAPVNNSPPKTSTVTNSPPKTTAPVNNSPPKTFKVANSPPKSTALVNNSPPQTKNSPPQANSSPESSPVDITPNGDMNTTPSPDTDPEVVSDASPAVPDLAIERSSSPVVIDSGGNSSPNTEEYVDALAQVPLDIPMTMTDGIEQKQPSPLEEIVGIDEEEFRPATEVFNTADPSAFDIDFLEKAGGNSNFQESALARQSLYVKFDPLVNAASPAVGPHNGLPRHLQHHAIMEGSEADLLQMQTPPSKVAGQRPEDGRLKAMGLDALAAAVAGSETQQDTPKGVDKLLAFSPPSSQEQSICSNESDAGFPIQLSMPSPGSGNSQEDIVQVLRYSQADLQNAVKAAREAEKKAAKSEKAQFEEERAETLKQMADKDKTIENMQTSNEDLRALVTDYERAMQEMMGDMTKSKSSQNSKFDDLQKEKDQAIEDMASVEVAFSDLHRRYEKLKQVVESLKKNEQILKECVSDYKTKLTKQEQKYHTLKAHAEEKIERANNEIDKVKSSYEDEIAGLQAAVKREQMMVASQERQIEQKTRDNAELTKICDELIAKMGTARS